MDERLRTDDPANRTEAELRGMVWLLVEALARRVLVELNGNRQRPSDWPKGQNWDELVESSHSVLRALAFDEAEIDRAKGMAILYERGVEPYDLEALKALVKRRDQRSWLPERIT